MTNTRRDFIKTAGGITVAGAALTGGLTASPEAAAQTSEKGKLTEHTLPPLPYAYDALEPVISAEIMTLHHDKHHAAYVKGLNAAETALAKARAAGDYAMVQHWSRQAAFNGGGHYLHSLFWKVMAPPGAGGGGEPGGALADKIAEDFGSFADFKAHFSAAARSVEGSGWGLLHYRREDNRLLVLQAENQQKLSPWGSTPILGVDVWEHAYYLDYKNDRGAYVDAWWGVVNWAQVAATFERLREGA